MSELLRNIPLDFWRVLAEMAPWLLFGFVAAGALSVLVSPRLIERHLGGRGLWPVFKAAAFGVPLPLCSCGVIPVAASLRRSGASRGATVAFLIATPQDGVDSILVSFSLLGWVFAIYRPIAALVSGLAGGALTSALCPERPDDAATGPTATDGPAGDQGHGKLRRVLSHAFGTLPRDIGKPLLGGLVVAALISALVPKDYFAPYLGGGVLAMVIMLLIGVPVYVCATASVPVAAALVLEGGVSPGAALVFLMTGPATNAATIATIWRVLGRRTALIYLAAVAAGALAAGLTLDYILGMVQVRPAPAMPWMIPATVKHVSAVALLAVLARAVVVPVLARRRCRGQPEPAAGTRLLVGGMTCSHCATSVRRALAGCPGVTSAEVDLGTGTAIVMGEDLDIEALCSAVRQLGYQAKAAVAADQPGSQPS